MKPGNRSAMGAGSSVTITLARLASCCQPRNCLPGVKPTLNYSWRNQEKATFRIFRAEPFAREPGPFGFVTHATRSLRVYIGARRVSHDAAPRSPS